MNEFVEFIKKYSGAIIGIIVSIVILCTGLYKFMIGLILVFVCAFIGNYVQRNKFDVKEKIKKFIDKM